MKSIIETFIEIAKISSPSGSEEEMSKYVQRWLEKNNFKYKVDKLNQIYAFSSKTPKLLLTAHLDTVQPCQNIKPIIKKGFICSDGKTILGADNKAWIVAMFFAIEQYKSSYKSNPPVELVFTTKEETGGGAENFDFSFIKSKEGITFDSAEPIGKIVLAAPYIYNFKAAFIGKAAHASRPNDGVSSLTPACNFVSKVKQGKSDNGLTTINIGLMSSGTGINTLPENTVVEGEVRSIDIKLFKKHLKEIESLAVKISKENRIKLKFSKDGYCPGYKYDRKDLFVMKTASNLKKMGYIAEYLVSTGVSDANSFAGAGIKLINLSDSVEFPHTTKEKISIKNLELLQKTMFNFLKDLV